MSYTRSRGSTSYTTKTRTAQTETEIEDGAPKCSGHNRRCKDFVAGPKTKNPGRKFYVCPLGKDDPDKCKYFKWADELQTPQAERIHVGDIITEGNRRYGGDSSRAAQSFGGAGQALGGGQALGRGQALGGGGPQIVGQTSHALGRSAATTPTANRIAPMTPQTGARIARHPSEEDEIDWNKVDTDELERAAIASTPGSSQSQSVGTRTETLQERLLAVPGSEDHGSKRKRDEEDTPRAADRTPKRAVTGGDNNPFLSPGHPASSPHHALSPSLSSFEDLSAHLHRQDRLIAAGEKAKEGFRKTIQKQKERIEELEERIKQLEGR